MSEAYAREDLASKSRTLRSLTDQIHTHSTTSNALIADTSESFAGMAGSMRGSAGRLTRSARQGDRVAVLKVAGLVVAAGLAVWWVGGWVFGWLFGR